MAAAKDSSRLKENFSPSAFGQGLLVVLLLYGLLAGWVMFSSGSVEKKQLAKLASQTVIVDWKQQAETPDNTTQSDGAVMGPQVPENAGAEKPAEPPPKEYSPPDVMESGLAAAPVDGLYEEKAEGHIPVVRQQDGLTAFKAYRRPFDIYAINQPLVSIAIAGMGLSDVATESAVRSMPPEVSFIMSPYAKTPDFWVKESRARGHEVWLTLPLESKDYPRDDTGPYTMLIGAPERENQTKLDWLMGRTDGYIGFVGSFSPDFMQSVNDMRPVVGAIYHHGLGFVDSSADPGMIPQTMAVGMKAPYSTVDIWLDKPDASQHAISAALSKLEQDAKKKGYAVGVIHALPVSYQQVLRWVETLPDKGLRLAPLSATTGY